MNELKKKGRYRAKVSLIAPQMSLEQVSELKTNMIGISLGTKNSEGMRLAASLEFMCTNFERSAIIITDDIYRLTLQVRDDVPEDISKAEAILEGENWFFRNKQLIERYQQFYDIKVIYLSDLANEPLYIQLLADMKELAQTSEVFKVELDLFVKYYMDRIFSEEEKTDTDLFRLKCNWGKEYLIEECAYFAYLKEVGWNSFCHAGTITTFERFANGEIANAPKQLLDLPFISFKFALMGKVPASHIPDVPMPKEELHK